MKLKTILWKRFIHYPPIHRRLMNYFTDYFQEQHSLRVPLGHGIYTPNFNEELGTSFQEIFLRKEYDRILDHIEKPKRWLDIGCYAGFFSLWLLWLQAQEGKANQCRALMVDADTCKQQWLSRLLAVNRLESQMDCKLGAIAKGTGSCVFMKRSFMDSSLATVNGESGRRVEIPIITEPEIAHALPGPYDLVKVDIEGAEYDFLTHYQAIVKQCRYLLMEWHSWHAGGGGGIQIRQMVEQLGMRHVVDVQPPRSVFNGKEVGVYLFESKHASP